MTSAEKNAQKYIKKINQRMSELANYLGFDSTEYSKYQKALELSGVDYEFKKTKTAPQGVFVIANTSENRAKVNALEKQIAKQKTKTKGDVKQEFREKVSKKKNKLKAEVTQKEIEEEKEKVNIWDRFSENLEILYRDSNNQKTASLLDEFRERMTGTNLKEREQGILDEIVEKIDKRAKEIRQEEEEYLKQKASEIESIREQERREAEEAIENFYKKGEYPF